MVLVVGVVSVHEVELVPEVIHRPRLPVLCHAHPFHAHVLDALQRAFVVVSPLENEEVTVFLVSGGHPAEYVVL